MVKILINNREYNVEPGTTILEACKQQGIEIPVFCYHKKLNVAGNCRMCLIEVEKCPKPVASCATEVTEGMGIHTDTELVHNARKGVLELLLINHPLDCPICDQGGECDLQDITMAYGPGSSRFAFYKRAVPNKYMGPFIKTVMNRCIHCTRCVRFATEIAGVEELGTTGRGENTEIISYMEKAVKSELSGNTIDLCPVGALTNKPYAFHGRPWELTNTPSIDVLDAVGSHIYFGVRDDNVLRVTPRVCEEINEEWISDKTRFAYDGISVSRIDQPYIRLGNTLEAIPWANALEFVADIIKNSNPNKIGVLSGELADMESQLALKMLCDSLEIHNRDAFFHGENFISEKRSQYIFNTPLEKLEKAKTIILVGTNPRHEATMVNARIKKASYRNNAQVFVIGEEFDLSYPYVHLGHHVEDLEKLLKKSDFKNLELDKAELIIGSSVMAHPDRDFILKTLDKLYDKYKMNINFLHYAASHVGALDIKFTPKGKGLSGKKILEAMAKNTLDLCLIHNANISLPKNTKTKIVYIGHHGDQLAMHADIILPSLSYAEKKSSYTNTFGLRQQTNKAIPAPGQAKDDWKIFRALADACGLAMPYNTLEQLQNLLPSFKSKARWQKFDMETTSKPTNKPFVYPVQNYYQHDIISKHSKNMANAVEEIVRGV